MAAILSRPQCVNLTYVGHNGNTKHNSKYRQLYTHHFEPVASFIMEVNPTEAKLPMIFTTV